jgi:hypothetical protein
MNKIALIASVSIVAVMAVLVIFFPSGLIAVLTIGAIAAIIWAIYNVIDAFM